MRSKAHEYLRELIAKFPDSPAKTLARKAYGDHPEMWKDMEACRGMVRFILGVSGNRNRKKAAKTLHREPRKAGWSDIIPEAVVQMNEWGSFNIPGPLKALILSDIHFPYHAPDALEPALEYGADRKPTHIILNGDTVDHYALSRWETDPRQRDFNGEIEATVQFLAGLRKAFPKARIILKHGNHEERYERYMRFKAAELLNVKKFTWEELFELKAHGIEMVNQKRPIRLGELNVIHGHEYVFQISNPVNPARGMYLRAKAHVLGGHFHQTSQHSEKSLEMKVISAWSTGCLCDLHPEYRPLNPWNHGFAWVEIDKCGAFRVENLRVMKGKVY